MADSADVFQDPVFDARTFRANDPQTWVFSWNLIAYFLGLKKSLGTVAQTLNRFTFIGQAAAIPLTPIPLPALTEGLYRVWAFLRVTTPAGVNSDVQLSIGSTTPDGVNQTLVGADVNGNTTTSLDQRPFFLKVKGGTALTYQTTYASAGVPAMQYELELLVEKVTL